MDSYQITITLEQYYALIDAVNANLSVWISCKDEYKLIEDQETVNLCQDQIRLYENLKKELCDNLIV